MDFKIFLLINSFWSTTQQVLNLSSIFNGLHFFPQLAVGIEPVIAVKAKVNVVTQVN